MSKVEMRECPEAAFSELGKIWINQVKVTKDFRSIFMSHLSEYAFKCFEVHSVPNLKAVINEEKCQRMIFTPLEYFICGEDPSDGFQKLQNANAPSQLCGRVFKFGEPTYSCRFAAVFLLELFLFSLKFITASGTSGVQQMINSMY